MIRASLTVMGIVLLTSQAFGERVTYSDDVAPIFFEHCVACHRPGEIAPMSLLSFKEARPWAKSIAKAVSSGKMPPWSGDSDKRTWSNDISLNETEIETILAWAEQGAREGNRENLPPVPQFPETWTLGEPDYIIELSAVDVPADGEDLFPKETVTIDIDEPKWIQAIEFLPGNRRVAHHSQTTYTNNSKAFENPSVQVGILGVWTAGMPPYVVPEGMGRIITPGAKILVDSHYHPYGEAATDVTRIGLYFGKGDLEKEVTTLTVVDTGIRIPPGASDHAEKAFHVFDRDMQILAFSPHLHVRGKAMSYTLTAPDGSREVLLDVPNYDYNWQWLYYPTEPIDAPKGSRLDVTAVWDNSADNPANPDPTKEIIYRGDTFSEMFVGFVEVVQTDGVYHTPPPAKEKIMALLSEHPEEDAYYFGGFLPFGLYVPQEGEGLMYIVNGSIMFTISLDDFSWEGDTLAVRTQLPTAEASATTTLVDGMLDEKGRLKATLQYGVDSPKPIKLPVTGQPLAMLNQLSQNGD